MTDRLEAFVADVLGSSAALRRSLEVGQPAAADDVLRGRPVVLTGMGSSRFAALDALPVLRGAGIDARVELASALDPADARQDSTLVAISSSGRTREVVAAAAGWPGPVVALTAAAASPLAERARIVVPLAGVAETAGIACQSYRATIAALVRLADGEAGSATVDAAADALDALIADHARWLGPAADLLDGPDELPVLGSGRRPGALEQAALMLREAPRIPAIALDAADWLHVGLYTMLPGGRALLLAGGPDDDEVVSTIAGRGGRTVTVGAAANGAALTIELPRTARATSAARSLVEPVVVELLAAELWRRTDARG